ncbi:sigma-70 family RNA polymerase sigma factor [Nonomuraea phyllanthi]|uniref:Sigma-70 family RNA polymerase sigma factor n=1 Tax=Nonomuraea phyllanthi TaxID=2219224 RepID=A0A5C4VHM5_9ACTN|nr:sigma-70 family RNA polymerase sigma factor [Nonomuraea phyllanthi]KAB8189027.1 sigma-70 family RNA polymerase sigma factor [Nonomuraea phyllanthi]
MDDHEFLADRFEEHRHHLRAVAYQLLGSPSEADDAVQEAWLRLSRSNTSEVENLRGWLTTVVARVSLNMLRSRSTLREDPLEAVAPASAGDGGSDPEQAALLSDSVGLAMLVVLDMLAPAERLALVLHDVFAVPFEEIAPIVDRSPAAARKLASRARRRVQGADPPSGADLLRQREIVSAFLAASRGGDFGALLALLDPDVVLHADRAAVLTGASGRLRGATAVAETFRGRAHGARLALIDGAAGAVWSAGGQPRMAFDFTIAAGRITEINLIADRDHLRELHLEVIEN